MGPLTSPDRQRIDHAARAYRTGQTSAEIAADLGVDPTTVRRWLVDAGVPLRRTGPRGRLDVPDEEIVGMREDGMSWREIARACDMSPTGVRKRYGAATGHRAVSMVSRR